MRTLRTRRRPKAGAALAGLLLAFPLVARAGDYRPAVAATVDERIERLEREIEDLKRERAAKPPADVVTKEDLDSTLDAAFKKQKVLAGWQDGFFLQSPSGDFKLKLRGYTQADARFFPFDDGRTGNDSGVAGDGITSDNTLTLSLNGLDAVATDNQVNAEKRTLAEERVAGSVQQGTTKLASAPSAIETGLKGWSSDPNGVDFVILPTSLVGEYWPLVSP